MLLWWWEIFWKDLEHGSVLFTHFHCHHHFSVHTFFHNSCKIRIFLLPFGTISSPWRGDLYVKLFLRSSFWCWFGVGGVNLLYCCCSQCGALDLLCYLSSRCCEMVFWLFMPYFQCHFKVWPWPNFLLSWVKGSQHR